MEFRRVMVKEPLLSEAFSDNMCHLYHQLLQFNLPTYLFHGIYYKTKLCHPAILICRREKESVARFRARLSHSTPAGCYPAIYHGFGDEA